MQLVAARQPLDRANFLAVSLHGEHQAGAHRLAFTITVQAPQMLVLAADCGVRVWPAIFPNGHRRACGGGSTWIAMAAPFDVQRDGGPGRSLCTLLRAMRRAECAAAWPAISSIETPNGASASLIALITAAGEPMGAPHRGPLALRLVALVWVSR